MKLRNLRWYIAALIFASTVINYVDRQTLSVVAPVLTRELGISQVEYGAILQWFLIAYTAMYVGSGVLVDRWGTRWSLAVGRRRMRCTCSPAAPFTWQRSDFCWEWASRATTWPPDERLRSGIRRRSAPLSTGW
jgi:MFS family permease